MSETITAIYENGLLRPLTPLHLPEHSEVEVEVRRVQAPSNIDARRAQVWASLEAAGILAPVAPVEQPAMREEERAALAEQLATPNTTPLSQMIVEEREEQP